MKTWAIIADTISDGSISILENQETGAIINLPDSKVEPKTEN